MSERFSGNWFFTDFLQSVLFPSLGFYSVWFCIPCPPSLGGKKGKTRPQPSTAHGRVILHDTSPKALFLPATNDGERCSAAGAGHCGPGCPGRGFPALGAASRFPAAAPPRVPAPAAPPARGVTGLAARSCALQRAAGEEPQWEMEPSIAGR